MSDEILRYTDLAALIQMARARGWPTERIVREMSAGLPYSEAMNLARKAAPLLDIAVWEFMRLRKNEWKSSLSQLGQQTVAATVFAKLVEVHTSALFFHVTLEPAQQIVRGVIKQFSFGFCLALCRRFHAPKVTQKAG